MLFYIQDGPMKNINFLIKPASSFCNMRCSYCFYADEAANRSMADSGVMTHETARTLLSETFSSIERGGSVSFAFQGGEPTMAGIGFFRDFTDLVRHYNTENVHVSYSIQTNGYALDSVWAELFKQEDFLVGISLDGTSENHDRLRPDRGGHGTWERVSANLQLLRSAGVEVNILCVVTKRLAKSPERTYASLKKTGVGYLQFIACLDPLEKQRGMSAWSLTPEDYGGFLCGLFDVWYQDLMKGQYVSVRLFDDYVHLAMGLPPGTCSSSGSCGAYLVIESDGTIYPCDFYCLDEWKLGQLGHDSLEAVMYGPEHMRFLNGGQRRPEECGNCRYRSICRGGCRRDWIFDETGCHNYLCPAFRRFFDYAGGRISQIARREMEYARNAGFKK